MRLRHNHIAACVIGLMITLAAVAQNNTNSPYTRFGYGQLGMDAPGQLRAMGGVSTSMRDSRYINPSNPASYSAVDSMTFMFDIGLAGQYSRFRADGGAEMGRWNANLEYVTMQFPLGRYLGFSAGFMPYSSVGYEFGGRDSVQIPVEAHQQPRYAGYTLDFMGRGGISQVYAGLSAELFRHVSIGANAYYMWGDVDHYRTLQFDASTYESEEIFSSLKVSDFRFRFGIQAYHTFSKRHNVSLGVVYEPKKKLGSRYVKLEANSNDTIVPFNSDSRFDLPTYIAIGLSYTLDDRLTVAFDYSQQQWSKAYYENRKDSLQDAYRIGLGISYQHNPYSRRYADRVMWRVGTSLYNSYLKDASSSNFGISFGVGLPLRNINSMINATLEYNHHAAEPQMNLREDLFKLTVNAAFSEAWFHKRKIR